MTLRCLNVFGRSSSENNNNNNYYSAQTQTVSNRFNASLPTSQSRAPVCVCICVSLPNALVYRFCACVCVCVCFSPNHCREPLSRSLSHSLQLTLLFAELPVRAAWPAWQVTVSANEREIRSRCGLTVIAIAWHRFINWFLLWFSQLVRCGAVCVRSVNERNSHTTHAFLFRRTYSSRSFLLLVFGFAPSLY